MEGIANSSYGLNVAKMAGVGREVLKQARIFQKQHFAEYDLQNLQPDLFSAVQDEQTGSAFLSEQEEEVLDLLQSFSLDQSSPVEALLFLKKLQEKLKAT